MKIKLLRNHEQWKQGEVINTSRTLALKLIQEGNATTDTETQEVEEISSAEELEE